jgi:hypothetical protein
VSDIVRWLDARRPAPPPSLRLAMIEALAEAGPDAGSLAERLAAAGLDALARVVAAPSARARAIHLLAADALITYACEAAVEEEASEGNDAVDRLTRRLDLHRFARTLEQAVAR